MKLSRKLALVTGAAGGIGSAIAKLFLQEGAHVLLVDCDQEALENLAAELGGDSEAHLADVSDRSDWENLADKINNVHGKLDILVNNAGISGFGDIDTIDADFWNRFQRINGDSIFHSIQTLSPLLRQSSHASIVNVGSIFGLKPNENLPAYSAAKASLCAQTKSYALHFAKHGEYIRCNAVHPGSTLTPMMEANLGSNPEERQANYEKRIAFHPLGAAAKRIVMPEDVAKAALFLASEDSAFITGIDLPVDGGATIAW